MFYPVNVDISDKARVEQGVLVLNPAESKRLIAKAVASLPEVQHAYKQARLAVTGGTGNAFVLEELTGEKIPAYQYSVGMVNDGMLTTTVGADRIGSKFFVNGESIQIEARDFFKTLEAGDVVIKGGNAVDTEGNAGVLAANDTGGTIGALLGIVCVRGIPLIMPIGLEKLIPSVPQAAAGWGQKTLYYAMGLKCCLAPVVTGLVVTEIQALGILTGVSARLVAAGGVGGSEGAVVILMEGYRENLERAMGLAHSVKGEPKVEVPRHQLSS